MDFEAYLAAGGTVCMNPLCPASEMVTAAAWGRIIIEQRADGVHAFFWRSDKVPPMAALALAMKMLHSALAGIPSRLQAMLRKMAERN